MMIFLSLPIPLANPGEPGTTSRDEAKKTGSGFRVDWTPSAPGPWHLGNLQVTPGGQDSPRNPPLNSRTRGAPWRETQRAGHTCTHLSGALSRPLDSVSTKPPRPPRPAVPRFGRGCHLQWTASSGYAARARRSRYARPNHNSAPTQPAELVLREQHQRPSLDDKSNTLHLLFVSPPLEQRLFA